MAWYSNKKLKKNKNGSYSSSRSSSSSSKSSSKKNSSGGSSSSSSSSRTVIQVKQKTKDEAASALANQRASKSSSSSSSSSRSRSTASSKADALKQLAAITDSSSGIQSQIKQEEASPGSTTKKSSSSSSSKSPTQAQIKAANLGTASQVDIKTGQPVNINQAQNTEAATLIGKQASGQPLTQKELTQAEVSLARTVGTVSTPSYKGVSTARDIAIARATTQIMAESAVKKQEQISKSYYQETQQLQKKYTPAETANILMGKKEISDKEAQPFYNINKRASKIKTAPLYLQQQRERITQEKYKGLVAQEKYMKEERLTSFQKKQLRENYEKSLKEYGTFTGTKTPKKGFFSKGVDRASDLNVIFSQKTDRGVLLKDKKKSTYDKNTQAEISYLKSKREKLLNKQYKTQLPGSTAYKKTEKELEKIDKKIKKYQAGVYFKEGAIDFIKYKPFSAATAVVGGAVVGAAIPTLGAYGTAVGGVKGAVIKYGIIGGGTFLTGKYASDTLRGFGTQKDVKLRYRYLGEKSTEFTLFSAGAGVSGAITKAQLKPKIGKETVSKFESKSMQIKNGNIQQTFAQESQIRYKAPFKKAEIIKVESGGIETFTPTGKNIYVSKGEIVSKITRPNSKPQTIKSQTEGLAIITPKKSLALKSTTRGKNFAIERIESVPTGKLQSKQTTDTFFAKKYQGLKSKLKQEGITTSVQKEVGLIDYGNVAVREYIGAGFSTKGKFKLTTQKKIKSQFKAKTKEISFKSKSKAKTSKVDNIISSSKGQKLVKKTVTKQKNVFPQGATGQTAIIKSTLTTKVVPTFTALAPLSLKSKQTIKPTLSRTTPISQFKTYQQITPRLITQNNILDISTRTAQKQIPISIQTYNTKSDVSQTQKTTTIPTFKYITPTITAPVGSFYNPQTPIPVIPIVPPMFFGGRSGRTGRMSKLKTKQPKGLTPSARAAVFNIRGKTSQAAIASGLGERFIQEPIKKKKKKKTKKSKR